MILIHEIRSKIAELKRRIAAIEDRMLKITPTLSGMPGGGGDGDKLGALVSEKMDLERQLQIYKAKLANEQRNVQIRLKDLPEQQARVAELKLVYEYSWNKISKMTGYSERHCKRIMEAARRKL